MSYPLLVLFSPGRGGFAVVRTKSGQPSRSQAQRQRMTSETPQGRSALGHVVAAPTKVPSGATSGRRGGKRMAKEEVDSVPQPMQRMQLPVPAPSKSFRNSSALDVVAGGSCTYFCSTACSRCSSPARKRIFLAHPWDASAPPSLSSTMTEAIRGMPSCASAVRLARRDRSPATADARHAFLAVPMRAMSRHVPNELMVSKASSGSPMRWDDETGEEGVAGAGGLSSCCMLGLLWGGVVGGAAGLISVVRV
jgi:hypothetical protein